MKPLDVDTVVVVLSDGTDVEYNTETHPNMGAYVVPGHDREHEVLWITIPIKAGTARKQTKYEN